MHRVQTMRESRGFTINQLVEESGLSETTIRRIEAESTEYKINRQVAELLAQALGCPVSKLFDASDLSHLGRPPLTGRPITNVTVSATITNTGSINIVTNIQYGATCTKCFVTMPLTNRCDNCSN